MKYDFDKITDRSGTYSMKWDVNDGVLPMWVADMDFETAPAVIEALKERVLQGVFGYTDVPDGWHEAYMNWWQRRHDYRMEKESLMFVTGVVPGISSIVRRMTNVAEKVVVQTPVYNIFFNSILNNGRVVLENPLTYVDGQYSMDFEDLEEKLADPLTTLMILCNPQNPVGRVWKKDELAKVGALCQKYGVTVISDEIHCDLVQGEEPYTPFAAVNEECRNNSITCIAPTKAFNIAGLQTAAISVSNPLIRNKVYRGINTDEVAEPNALAMAATVAAFNEGETWLIELTDYLFENRRIAEGIIRENIQELKPVKATATYLMWVDCSEITNDTNDFCQYLREETGLYVSAGGSYGSTGEAFIRINLATQRSRMLDGLDRLKKGVDTYKNLKKSQI